jgi:hypothetical protein
MGECVNGLGGSGHALAFPPANKTMQPRIYTYKITFEEVPYWYWGVHKEKRYNDGYMGSPVTHKWMWEFYTPKMQILELFQFTAEGWKEAKNVEDRIIKPDLNNPLCLNERCGGITSLSVLRRTALRQHDPKDENGKSLMGVENAKRLNSIIHAEKDERGKSLHGVKHGKRLHSERDEQGRSLQVMRLHSKKNEIGKSVVATLNAQNMNKQRWQCLVTGKITNAGALTGWQKSRKIDTSLRVRLS